MLKLACSNSVFDNAGLSFSEPGENWTGVVVCDKCCTKAPVKSGSLAIDWLFPASLP